MEEDLLTSYSSAKETFYNRRNDLRPLHPGVNMETMMNIEQDHDVATIVSHVNDDVDEISDIPNDSNFQMDKTTF